jgi:D-serine deaminase-like pyridoxal phosphate-dependent protein
VTEGWSRTVDVASFPTPFAQLDEHRLRENIDRMQGWVAGRRAGLRPHFKTHRSVHVARRQLQAGALGFTCSDLAQLNALLGLGIDDILISSPVQLDRAAWPAVRRAALSGRVTFSVCSRPAADALAAALGPDSRARTWLEIDVGCHRTGMDPEHCSDVGRRAASAGLDVCGIFAYPGQGYHPGAAELASAQEREGLAGAHAALTDAGLRLRHVSAGSSPTVRYAEAGLITEYRPGTYVLSDRQQVVLGVAEPAAIALTIISTVLESRLERVVLDVGGKGLGRDDPPWLPGHAAVGSVGGPVVSRLFDHHSVVDDWIGERPKPGQRVAVLPNNVNSALALQSAVVMVVGTDRSGRVIELVHDT